MKPFWKSRKFLTLMLDIVISASVYFVGKYVTPVYAEDILFVIALVQPAIIAVILAIAWEDSAALAAGTHPSQVS